MSTEREGQAIMSEIGGCWLKARECIKTMLRELRPDMSERMHDHNAAAIMARLASSDPPILTCYASKLKD